MHEGSAFVQLSGHNHQSINGITYSCCYRRYHYFAPPGRASGRQERLSGSCGSGERRRVASLQCHAHLSTTPAHITRMFRVSVASHLKIGSRAVLLPALCSAPYWYGTEQGTTNPSSTEYGTAPVFSTLALVLAVPYRFMGNTTLGTLLGTVRSTVRRVNPVYGIRYGFSLLHISNKYGPYRTLYGQHRTRHRTGTVRDGSVRRGLWFVVGQNVTKNGTAWGGVSTVRR